MVRIWLALSGTHTHTHFSFYAGAVRAHHEAVPGPLCHRHDRVCGVEVRVSRLFVVEKGEVWLKRESDWLRSPPPRVKDGSGDFPIFKRIRDALFLAPHGVLSSFLQPPIFFIFPKFPNPLIPAASSTRAGWRPGTTT